MPVAPRLPWLLRPSAKSLTTSRLDPCFRSRIVFPLDRFIPAIFTGNIASIGNIFRAVGDMSQHHLGVDRINLRDEAAGVIVGALQALPIKSVIRIEQSALGA